MPTIRTVTVKPSGGDYSSLAGAEAGEQGDLVSLDRVLHIECYTMNDTTKVTFDGWTMDATRYARVYTPTSERHDGKLNTNKYRLTITGFNGAFFTAFDAAENYMRVEGIQVIADVDAAGRSGISGVAVHIENCIVVLIANGFTGHNGVGLTCTDDNCYAKNNIIYIEDGPAGSNGMVFGSGNFTFRSFVYNNTISGFALGMVRGGGNFPTGKNNLVQNCTTCYDGSVGPSPSSNNISEDASSPDVSYRNRAVSFVDEGNFDFHLSPSDTQAIDQGIDLSADSDYPFSDDIDGETRSGTWDIGADEVVITPYLTGFNRNAFPKHKLRTKA